MPLNTLPQIFNLPIRLQPPVWYGTDVSQVRRFIFRIHLTVILTQGRAYCEIECQVNSSLKSQDRSVPLLRKVTQLTQHGKDLRWRLYATLLGNTLTQNVVAALRAHVTSSASRDLTSLNAHGLTSRVLRDRELDLHKKWSLGLRVVWHSGYFGPKGVNFQWLFKNWSKYHSVS